MNRAPIALFVYKRLSHTEATVNALAKNDLAGESDLFVFSDAPRGEQPREQVDRVRDFLRTIRGFRKVEIIERETNFGLSKNITGGVTRLVGEYGTCIVLEDDLLTSPSFLTYMNAALERYRDHPEVMQVSGYMFPADLPDEESDALFLPLTTSWGWATWKRAWEKYDPTMSGYIEISKNRSLRRKFNIFGAYDYFNLLKLQKNGKIDSWAIRWYLSVFLANGLVLFPKQTLIFNSGFDGSGEHCQEAEYGQQGLHRFSPVRYPSEIAVSPHKMKIYASIKNRLGLAKRIQGRLHAIIKKYL